MSFRALHLYLLPIDNTVLDVTITAAAVFTYTNIMF